MHFDVHVALRAVVFMTGLLIVVRTLQSAVRTIILPRRAFTRIARGVFLLSRIMFEFRVRRCASYDIRDSIMALYAPLTLLCLEWVWLALVWLGYALMFWGIGAGSAADACHLSGSSLVALGFSAPSKGLPAMLVVTEASIGLLLVALLISYLPTMHAAFSRREVVVTTVHVRAGAPPDPVKLVLGLHRLGQLGSNAPWEKWEEWFVELEETHTSMAALVHYRSSRPECSWVTTSGAILDAASLIRAAVDLPTPAGLELCYEAGARCLTKVSASYWYFVSPPPPQRPLHVDRATFDSALDRLHQAGVPVVADRDGSWAAFTELRSAYEEGLDTLAHSTVAPEAPWCPRRIGSRPRFMLPRSVRGDCPHALN